MVDNLPEPTMAIPSAATEILLTDLAFATLAPPTIEIIQQTPTPLPTATATPTPTPIVYAIQSGDTLLAIAIDNRTTVEEIQQLNPNVRPELLSIGQEIELPPPATPVFSGEAPTPLPIQVEVKSAMLYPDGAGGVWVVGEITNTANYFLENAQLEITLFGESGLEVARGETWVPAALIGPSETTPFGLLFPQKPDGNLQASVKVIDGFTSAILAEQASQYSGLTADDPKLIVNGSVVTVNLKINNEGSAVSQDVSILVSIYDPNNQLIGFSIGVFPSGIEVGKSLSYSQAIIVPGGKPDYARIKILPSK